MNTETAIKDFKPGIYKHFKGNLYLAIMLATDCEDIEKKMVVYVSLYENQKSQVWIRPVEDFMGEKKLEDGTNVKRFTFIKSS
jgi:hypothetical protein